MISDLSILHRQLAEYMSFLSEIAYSAGWMEGLVFALWEALEGKTCEFGRLKFTDEIRNNLKQFSEKIEGWIIFDEILEERFISFAEWEKIRKSTDS